MTARHRVLPSLLLCACSWFTAPAEPPLDTQCAHKRSYTCWVKVEGGTFSMGAQSTDPTGANYDPAAAANEGPVREITVPTFWMMQTEFASTSFLRCVEDADCRDEDVSAGGYGNHRIVERRDHPINGISWQGAQTACASVNGRLPTEAEWEYAARGSEGRRFPWGNEEACGVVPRRTSGAQGDQALGDDMAMAKAPCDNDGTVATRDVRGMSAAGIKGMAGNVWEWVADWYGPYEGVSAPATGTQRVQRGGGWTSTDPVELRSAARISMPPDARVNDVGFRCVWSPP